jgi:hypothetical protein
MKLIIIVPAIARAAAITGRGHSILIAESNIHRMLA